MHCRSEPRNNDLSTTEERRSLLADRTYGPFIPHSYLAKVLFAMHRFLSVDDARRAGGRDIVRSLVP